MALSDLQSSWLVEEDEGGLFLDFAEKFSKEEKSSKFLEQCSLDVLDKMLGVNSSLEECSNDLDETLEVDSLENASDNEEADIAQKVAEIQSRRERIQYLKKLVTHLDERAEGLENLVKDIRVKFRQEEGKVKHYSHTGSAAKYDYEEQKQKSENLELALTQETGKLGKVKGRINTIWQELGELGQEINDLSEQIPRYKKQWNNTVDEKERQIKTLSQDVSGIEARCSKALNVAGRQKELSRLTRVIERHQDNPPSTLAQAPVISDSFSIKQSLVQTSVAKQFISRIPRPINSLSKGKGKLSFSSECSGDLRLQLEINRLKAELDTLKVKCDEEKNCALGEQSTAYDKQLSQRQEEITALRSQLSDLVSFVEEQQALVETRHQENELELERAKDLNQKNESLNAQLSNLERQLGEAKIASPEIVGLMLKLEQEATYIINQYDGVSEEVEETSGLTSLSENRLIQIKELVEVASTLQQKQILGLNQANTEKEEELRRALESQNQLVAQVDDMTATVERMMTLAEGYANLAQEQIAEQEELKLSLEKIKQEEIEGSERIKCLEQALLVSNGEQLAPQEDSNSLKERIAALKGRRAQLTAVLEQQDESLPQLASTLTEKMNAMEAGRNPEGGRESTLSEANLLAEREAKKKSVEQDLRGVQKEIEEVEAQLSQHGQASSRLKSLIAEANSAEQVPLQERLKQSQQAADEAQANLTRYQDQQANVLKSVIQDKEQAIRELEESISRIRGQAPEERMIEEVRILKNQARDCTPCPVEWKIWGMDADQFESMNQTISELYPATQGLYQPLKLALKESEQQALIREKQTENQTLRKHADTLAEEIDTLRAQLGQASDSRSRLQTDHATGQEKLQGLEAEKLAAEERANDLQAEIKACRVTLSQKSESQSRSRRRHSPQEKLVAQAKEIADIEQKIAQGKELEEKDIHRIKHLRESLRRYLDTEREQSSKLRSPELLAQARDLQARTQTLYDACPGRRQFMSIQEIEMQRLVLKLLHSYAKKVKNKQGGESAKKLMGDLAHLEGLLDNFSINQPSTADIADYYSKCVDVSVSLSNILLELQPHKSDSKVAKAYYRKVSRDLSLMVELCQKEAARIQSLPSYAQAIGKKSFSEEGNASTESDKKKAVECKKTAVAGSSETEPLVTESSASITQESLKSDKKDKRRKVRHHRSKEVKEVKVEKNVHFTQQSSGRSSVSSNPLTLFLIDPNPTGQESVVSAKPGLEPFKEQKESSGVVKGSRGKPTSALLKLGLVGGGRSRPSGTTAGAKSSAPITPEPSREQGSSGVVNTTNEGKPGYHPLLFLTHSVKSSSKEQKKSLENSAHTERAASEASGLSVS